MNNREIAKLLKEVAAAMTIKGDNPFKILAYERAAESLENSLFEAENLYREGKLNEIEGVGSSIAGHLQELFDKGKVPYFEKLKEGVPAGMFSLLEIPGIGAKKAYKLAKNLGLKNGKTAVSNLYEAAKRGKIASITSFGEKSQEDILKAIEAFQKGKIKSKRILFSLALKIVRPVVEYLKRNPICQEVQTLGSLRRKTATVGDLDIAVATEKPLEAIDYFMVMPAVVEVVEKGPAGATILLPNDFQVDLRVQKPESFGTMLQYFTGSKAHNVHLREIALKQGWSLSEYGLKKNSKIYEFKNEEDLYQKLGMDWIPPELREDKGEIEASLGHILPDLVKLEDIKGDLHIHSDYPLEPSHDLGAYSFQKILEKAERFYSYLAFSEHNPSVSKHSPESIYRILLKRKKIIEQLKLTSKIVRVINLLEVDILADGNLAIDNKSLTTLDAVIASIHSAFQQSKETMTRRILKGLNNQKVKILGHPTGRLFGFREPIEADWEEIFKFCQKNNKALEINSAPNRQDLPEDLVRKAVEMGIKLVINSDSHELVEKKALEPGISVARRGWAQKADILNTMGYNEIMEWIKDGR